MKEYNENKQVKNIIIAAFVTWSFTGICVLLQLFL